MSETVTASKTKKLIESSIMVAIATVLSMIKLLDLPYGGTVTIGCMLPVIIISYRHGIRWGLLSGAVFGIIQQLLGLNTLSYVTTWQSVAAVMLLDYIVAFTVIGLGGIYRKSLAQPRALVLGTVTVCILRYICHVISGATVWAGLSIPTEAAFWYSVGYNATYMIPETIVTSVIAYYIGSILDMGQDNIVPFSKSRKEPIPVTKWIAGLLIAAVAVFDVRSIFAHLQNADSGEFDATGFASVSWGLIAAATIACTVCAVILFYTGSKKSSGK
ncbi:MAG: energy-coupled thiamine transporter ThiT [Lachnospiraceae bacterium]|nr:energy-coupled thiamine transporter ThiT [Lachnospiraceae bacterium]